MTWRFFLTLFSGGSDLGPLVFLALYLFPFLIAVARKHENKRKVFLVNLLLGITGYGWLAAFYMALTGRAEGENLSERQRKIRESVVALITVALPVVLLALMGIPGMLRARMVAKERMDRERVVKGPPAAGQAARSSE